MVFLQLRANRGESWKKDDVRVNQKILLTKINDIDLSKDFRLNIVKT